MPFVVALEFFADCQQQDANDDNGNKCVSFPVELFLQEDTGQQQGNDADRGKNGGSDRILSAQCINIGELAGGFEYGCEDFVLVLGQRTELNLLTLHKDEQAQSKQGEGQLIAGIGNGFHGFLGNIHKGSTGHIFNQEERIIQKGAEGIQQGIHEGHAEGHDGQLFAQTLLSGGLAVVFDEADTQNTDGNDGDGDPGEQGDLFLQKNNKQKSTNDTGGILNGIGNGFLQKAHSEVGEGHGDDIEQRNGQIDQQVDGVVVDILCQQGENCVSTHNNANPHADLQVGIFFIRTGAFLIKQFCSTPKNGGANGEKQPGHMISFFL